MIAAAFLTSAMTVDNSLEVGKNAPKIETIDGTNVVNDANFSKKTNFGKTTVVNFWNPKKPSSRIANKTLSRKYSENNENVQFISICTDADDKLMNEVMKIDGVNPDINFSFSQISPRVFKDYDVENSPRTFVISPEGKILEMI